MQHCAARSPLTTDDWRLTSCNRSEPMQDILSYIDSHRDEYIGRIQRACQQPSISTQNIGIAEMAELCWTMSGRRGGSSRLRGAIRLSSGRSMGLASAS